MLNNGKYYSEITKQSYFSEEAKAAEEKAYQEQLAIKEKEELALKENREARAKEYNEAIESLINLRKELNKKHADKVAALKEELQKFDEELDKSYKDQLEKTNAVIEKFEKDYPRGYNFTVRFGKPNSSLEKVLNDFLNNDFFNDPFFRFFK